MNCIGFICHLKENRNPIDYFKHDLLCRVVSLDQALRKRGYQLFIYSRLHINKHTKLSTGYVIEENQFVFTFNQLPKTNVNWSTFKPKKAKNRSHLSRLKFLKWAKKNHIDFYPSDEFITSVRDKYETFKTVEKILPEVNIHTENLTDSTKQITRFASENSLVFIKKNKGAHGKNIISIKKENGEYILELYKKRSQEIHYTTQTEKVIKIAKRLIKKIKDKNLIIQKGIRKNTKKTPHFIIRTTVLASDQTKKSWNYFSKIVTSRKEDGLANLEQGGKSYLTEDFLPTLYRKKKCREIQRKAKQLSFLLAEKYFAFFSHKMCEISFDFLVDKSDDLFLCEINSHPWMVRPQIDKKDSFSNIFNLSQKEKQLYNKYILPYSKKIADFLLTEEKREIKNHGKTT